MGIEADGEYLMSQYEQKPNTASLFRNERKEKDTHPDHKGTANIEGVEYWMDAWINTTKEGKKYFGIKFKRKEEAHGPIKAAREQAKLDALAAGDDTDLPF
jgi:uncharacterized protein (DUF736 family)